MEAENIITKYLKAVFSEPQLCFGCLKTDKNWEILKTKRGRK